MRKRVMFINHRGFRIDDCSQIRGCFKIRHMGGESYMLMDFASYDAARAFIDSKLGAIK